MGRDEEGVMASRGLFLSIIGPALLSPGLFPPPPASSSAEKRADELSSL